MKTLTQKASLNFISFFLDYMARILVSLIITPILVSGLGNAIFGVWQILLRLVGYLTVADGSPIQALKWIIAKDQSLAGNDQKRRHIGSALGVWLFMLPSLTVLGLLFIWVSPKLTDITPENFPSVRLACALLVINLIFSTPLTIPESVLRGMNLGYKRMGIVACIHIVSGLLIAGAIYLHLGLTGVAAATLTVSIMSGILFWYLVKVYVPWFGAARPSLKEIKSFFRMTVWYSLSAIINKLLLAGDVIILGFLISSSTVTSFVLTNYFSLSSVAIISMLVGATMPGLGGILGSKQYDRISLLRHEITAMSCVLATAFGTCTLLLNRSFINLWVGTEYYAGFWTNLLLVIIMVQMVFLNNESHFINITLNVRKKAILEGLSVILSIGFIMYFIKVMSLPGLCVGILIGRSLLTFSYPLIVRSFIGVSSKEGQKGIICKMTRPGLVMIALFACAAYMGETLLIKSWFTLIVCSVISFPLFFGISFISGLSRTKQRRLKERFRKLSIVDTANL